MELALKKTEKLSSEVFEVRNPAQIKYALLETLLNSFPFNKLGHE